MANKKSNSTRLNSLYIARREEIEDDCFKYMAKHFVSQSNRQTDGQIGRQTDKQFDSQSES